MLIKIKIDDITTIDCVIECGDNVLDKLNYAVKHLGVFEFKLNEIKITSDFTYGMLYDDCVITIEDKDVQYVMGIIEEKFRTKEKWGCVYNKFLFAVERCVNICTYIFTITTRSEDVYYCKSYYYDNAKSYQNCRWKTTITTDSPVMNCILSDKYVTLMCQNGESVVIDYNRYDLYKNHRETIIDTTTHYEGYPDIDNVCNNRNIYIDGERKTQEGTEAVRIFCDCGCGGSVYWSCDGCIPCYKEMHDGNVFCTTSNANKTISTVSSKERHSDDNFC